MIIDNRRGHVHPWSIWFHVSSALVDMVVYLLAVGRFRKNDCSNRKNKKSARSSFSCVLRVPSRLLIMANFKGIPYKRNNITTYRPTHSRRNSPTVHRGEIPDASIQWTSKKF